MSIIYSIIIPAYNEEALLPRLLDSIDVARNAYHGDFEAIEVIVADNDSNDLTAVLAHERGCAVPLIKKRVIGAARNGGAEVAQGSVYCFCDADSQLHPNTFNVIESHMKSGKVVGGATGWELERTSLGINVSMLFGSLLLWIIRVNTGVIFCPAVAFQAIGGYDDTLDCAEDIRFFHALRAYGRRHGLKTLRTTAAQTTISARKWDQHGDWHIFLTPFKQLAQHGSIKKVIRDYWYDDAR